MSYMELLSFEKYERHESFGGLNFFIIKGEIPDNARFRFVLYGAKEYISQWVTFADAKVGSAFTVYVTEFK